MKILITGAAGFIGRHLHTALLGEDVFAVDVAGPISVNALDIFRDDDTHFDLVLHCAATSPHRAAIDRHAVTVGASNLELDAAMFAWAARTRPGRVVYFSSSAAYPVGLQAGHVLYRMSESYISQGPKSIGVPDAIYGWTKLTGERLTQAYRQQGGKVTVLRPFSGYGEDQSADFPFGAFRDRARGEDDPFTVWGNGSQVRDWIHVDDVVGATLAAVEQGVDGPVNLCTGVGTSMLDLAAMFADAAGYRPAFQTVPEAPSGVAYRVGDPTLMETFYRPRVTLEEGVMRAVGA